MSEKDRVISAQLVKFRQNWPKLTEGQDDMYYRNFSGMREDIIPLVADRLLDLCQYPPKQADIRKAENSFIVEKDSVQQTETYAHGRDLTPEEKKFNTAMIPKLRQLCFAHDFDQWEAIMQQMVQESRCHGLDHIAEQFEIQIEDRRVKEMYRKEQQATERQARRIKQ